MVINFTFKIYLSYVISKEEIGVFYTFLDTISIGIMVYSGFKDSLVREFDKGEFECILYWYSLIFWGIFLGVLVFEITFYHFSYPIYYLVLLLFINSLVVFYSYINAAMKNYKVMLFENLIMSVGLVVAFLLTKSLFLAFLFSYLARLVWIKMFLKLKIKKCQFNKVKVFLKNTLFSSLMYFFSGVFISASSLVILYFFKDNNFLAEYQMVVKSIFFSLVAVFVFPLNTYLFPEISKFVSKNMLFEIKRIEKKLVKYLLVMFLILIIGLFITKFVIALIFPVEYKNSYIYLNMILPFLPFIAYTTFALNILKGFDRFDLALYVRILGSLVFFISSYIFYLLQMKAFSIIISLDFAFLSMAFLAYFFKRRFV